MNKKLYQSIFICLLLLVIILAVAVPGIAGRKKSREVMSQGKQVTVKHEQSGQAADAQGNEKKSQESLEVQATPDPTEGVYTFLQGPKSWSRRIPWSGKWGETMYDGGSFGGFGCGLCCMANIYCSLTQYKASPVETYRYAKEKTEYGGGGAIAWEYMQQTLSSLGFQVKLKRKPKSYQVFQKAIESSQSCIVLVSSANSQCYWKNTPGHYVTIFLYDKQKDRVFLADSGDPEHNRHWVAVKKIYRSLKTDSDYQYLQVSEYDSSKDGWKHKKAGGTWVKTK